MRIPKLIHQIWLGGKPMSDIFRQWSATWKKWHPDWAYHLWTEDNLPESRYPNLIEKSVNLSQRSNIYRYELLHDIGGIYVDVDFECCKNFEPLIGACDAFVAESGRFFERPTFCPAIMGGVAGHPFFRLLVEGIPKIDVTRPMSLGTQYCTHKVELFGRAMCWLQPKYVYPYFPAAMVAKQPRDASEFPNAYAVHHWSSVWWRDSQAKLTGRG